MSEEQNSDYGAGYEIARPVPSAVMESLRAIGYSAATAVADLVDNSISASAKNVWIDFFWNGEQSYVTVIDDGKGMSESELVRAMTLGSKRPTETREDTDLGRFGMGLKTASFSQCRRLTVRSKNEDGASAIREWELDYIIEAGDWLLRRASDSHADHVLRRLDEQKSGTAVLWRVVDRLVAVGTSVEDRSAHNRFLKVIEDVDEHLAMTFHRFIASRVRLWLNNRSIEPWDPFLSKHDFTQESPSEPIVTSEGIVTVKGFVLPHHSKLSDKVYEKAAGRNGWSAHQGLYIYRNNRLLVGGGWTGVGLKREEQFKLARLSVDIPNTMDSQWELDIRKSRARPPAAVVKRLKELAEIVRERAKQTYRARGKILTKTISKDFAFVWLEEQKEGKIRYLINREHPLVKRAEALVEDKRTIQLLLQIIEESIPLEQIWVHLSESLQIKREAFDGCQEKEIEDTFSALRNMLFDKSLTGQELEKKLLEIEPFNRFPDLIAKLSATR